MKCNRRNKSKRHGIRHLIALCIVSFFNGTTAAWSYCTAPDVPRCVTGFSTFEDEYSFNSCRQELDQMRDDVVEHSNCLKRQIDDEVLKAQRADDAAQATYKSAVEYWNCKAQDPDGYCSRP